MGFSDMTEKVEALRSHFQKAMPDCEVNSRWHIDFGWRFYFVKNKKNQYILDLERNVLDDWSAGELIRDLSLQGALISLKHSPRLQSELQVIMETPGVNGMQRMQLRGYVVRIDGEAEKGQTSVGVVFTD